jgi:hypothetical protein
MTSEHDTLFEIVLANVRKNYSETVLNHLMHPVNRVRLRDDTHWPALFCPKR